MGGHLNLRRMTCNATAATKAGVCPCRETPVKADRLFMPAGQVISYRRVDISAQPTHADV
ncbi:uncharacterized protein N7484_011821 [Penicillium longicatenatum]|uniref:uncharacterized protein n=1 Tax=Penicillium longicatenatum TaxID=1561947 RepID=UPI0025494E87|nr:uncharacterized protein N7484_011821 [Penicillium longicatenatum]KAJ5631721.1 hypothetical protein N7484_011821 [Penicillium longicatenatum]